MKTENIILLGVGVLALAYFLKKGKEKKLTTIAPMNDEKVSKCKEEIALAKTLMKVAPNFDWATWEKQQMETCLAK
jgi:hypothetical protein